MNALDPFVLARIQFAANISFHILFPTITIALGWVLLYLRLRYNRSGDMKWMDIYHFWVKIFALSFGMGVVSGITMSFQFGTNWPGFMESVGNIAGPLLAYEVLTAFFLEAVFLGIMLFGFSKVSARVHTVATFLVTLGTSVSAFWIIVLNSWMHTPQGFEMRDGVAYATDWFAIVFNPSMPYRLSHMLIASGLTVSFLIAGVSALRWLLDQRTEAVKTALRLGVTVAAVLIPVQIVVGDLHGLNTLEYQPAKIAAMEGNWETRGNVPLLLFAWPDEAARENRFEAGIPSGASVILKRSPEGVVPGLNEFVSTNGEILHPPVKPLFFGFRIMVGIGMLMLLVAWASAWQMRKGRELKRPMAFVLVGMMFSGWVATLAGWYVTEIGRQPWLVSGVLTTREAVGPIGSGLLASSLVAYLMVYALLLTAYIGVIIHLARKGDEHGREDEANLAGGGPLPAVDPAMRAE